jgi:quinoprotein glucose dehydrogenase
MFPRPMALRSVLAAVALTAQADPASPAGTNAAPLAPVQAAQRRLRPGAGLQLSAWAAEPLVRNLTSLDFDDQGRAYVVETGRRRTSVFDIRNFKDWVEDDLALRTVPERIEFLRGQLATNQLFRAAATRNGAAGFRDFNQDGVVDLRDLEVESERIRLVWDANGDGTADQAMTYSERYDSPVSGVAAGILVQGDHVWFTCIPDLWRMPAAAKSNPQPATERERLLGGFGVHVAFGGHDLHGLTLGPDGRLYFSIADRGAHVETKEGGVIRVPDSGAIFRCEPDGTRLELYAQGLRNPQELAFDAEGFLWTGDNNGDGGDKARWTLVLPGANYGWTIGWQWLPKMGAWNSERLWQLPGTNTAAYLVPPVAHIGHGPAGIAYYPGIGLGDRFAHHFFYCDFPGGVRTFQVERRQGWFAIADAGPWLEDNSASLKTGKLLWDLSPVDVAFPPDGGVVVADWVAGWDKTEQGRLWRLHDPTLERDPRIQEVKSLLAEGFTQRTPAALIGWLGHADLRIRQRAQFELARRGTESLPILLQTVTNDPQLVRQRHALRATRQIVRSSSGRARLAEHPQPVLAWLDHPHPEIALEACRLWGDVPLSSVGTRLTRLFDHPDPLIAAEAMQAASRQSELVSGHLEAIERVLGTSAGSNPALRHAAVQLLTRHLASGDPAPAGWALGKNPKADVRLAWVLALREVGSPRIAEWLRDPDPQVVLEAARGIHDRPIPKAYPALIQLLETGLPSESWSTAGSPHPYSRAEWESFVLRRAINAAFRLGTPSSAETLGEVVRSGLLAESLQVQALESLRDWGQPPRRDRLTGLIQPLPARPTARAQTTLIKHWTSLTATNRSPALVVAAIEAARANALPELSQRLRALAGHPDALVRAAVAVPETAPETAGEPIGVPSEPKEPDLLIQGGHAARGRKLFAERADWGCQRCHKLGGEGGEVGPNLTGIGARRDRRYLLTSILQPNRDIAPGYETVILTLANGDEVVGILKSENATTLELDTPENGRIRVPKATVKGRDRAPSTMPDGLGSMMKPSELRDLIEALASP